MYHTVEPITETVSSLLHGAPSRDQRLRTFGDLMEHRRMPGYRFLNRRKLAMIIFHFLADLVVLVHTTHTAIIILGLVLVIDDFCGDGDRYGSSV